ncbi:MAG: hypothetical protein ACK559_11770, partial [bacterium]
MDGTPASKYLTWLENGTLVGVSLETAFKLLQKEFFDEEEEALIACEKWRSRKQKLDETVDEYHTVFVSNADKAGIIVDKELLRQWGRNVLPQARVAVQTARFSNPALTFQSGVRIAQDVQAALGGDEPATAYRRGVHEDMDEELVDARKVRAIAATAAEGVMKGMETEMANVKRELLKAQEQVKVMEAREEKRNAMPERPEWKPERPERRQEPEWRPERSEWRPERQEWKPERPEWRPERPEWGPERPEWRPERPGWQPERPERKPERPQWRQRGRGRGGYSKREESQNVVCTKCG